VVRARLRKHGSINGRAELTGNVRDHGHGIGSDIRGGRCGGPSAPDGRRRTRFPVRFGNTGETPQGRCPLFCPPVRLLVIDIGTRGGTDMLHPRTNAADIGHVAPSGIAMVPLVTTRFAGGPGRARPGQHGTPSAVEQVPGTPHSPGPRILMAVPIATRCPCIWHTDGL
jgi:hypothetical protein